MKISIITVTYNSAEFLKSCIDSVLSQDYPDIEYIIVDGASKDNTTDIIKSYGIKVTKFISEPDNGIYDAMNKGIALASGDIVGILNSDDIYNTNNVISTVVNEFIEKEIDSLYGDLVYVDQATTNRVIRYWKSSKFKKGDFLWGWHPPHPTFFVKKEVYNKLGVFRTDFKISADFELMLRFLEKGEITTSYLPNILVRMRVGGVSNKSLRHLIRKSKEDYIAVTSNHVGGFITLFCKNIRKVSQFIFRKGNNSL